MIHKPSRFYANTLFIAAFIGIAFIYDYPSILFKRPQSIHKWRQSDCASIALNYCQGGMHFFDPQTHNLTSDHGTTGKGFTSEVPVLYYTVALLYKAFGYHEFLFRLVNTLLFFLGLFSLFRLFGYLLNDTFWGAALSLIFFSSPVLAFYGNNFLTNVSAFSLSITGFYFFIRYLHESKYGLFCFALLFFLLAGAFKLSALFLGIALFCTLLLETIGIKVLEKSMTSLKLYRTCLPFVLLFILTGGWIFFVHRYNTHHDCTYFSTTIFPIWSLSKRDISDILEQIHVLWFPQYFHITVFLFLLVSLLFLLLNLRKIKPLFGYILLFLFVEGILYFLLQFWTFGAHDYYTIDLFIIPAFIVLCTFLTLKNHYSKLFQSRLFKFFFFLFLAFNIRYTAKCMHERYEGRVNDFKDNEAYYTLTPYLRQVGVSQEDTVISIPDYGPSSLYLMNQKGWTTYTDSHFNKGTPLKYNADTAGVQWSISKGAKYLILKNVNELYQRPYLQSFCTHLTGSYKDVLIFDLRKNTNRNFELVPLALKSRLYCDAERLSLDNSHFLGSDSALFGNATSQTSAFALSGFHAIALNSRARYGMTITLADLKSGESLEISVFRKIGGDENATLIASADSFYDNQYKIAETQKGWEKLNKHLVISKESAGKPLSIYLYNPGPGTAYFDDLEICIYKTPQTKKTDL